MFGFLPFKHRLCAVVLLGAAVLAVCSGGAAQSEKTKLVLSPELQKEVAKFKVWCACRLILRSSLRAERQMMDKLVEACQDLESIYWRQSDPLGLELFHSLAGSTTPVDVALRRFLRINGSRFDLIANNAPFVGTEPWPPGRNIFPWGITRKEFDSYVAAHPEQKDGLYDPFTVVRRSGDKLETIPYHVAYKEWVDPCRESALREAAALSDDPAFAKFLRLRADSLQTDNYFASDIAWVSLVNPKFDVIFAPYETYLDDLLGVKTSYGAAILVRNEAESRKLDVFQKIRCRKFRTACRSPRKTAPSKRGLFSPMEVMDTPYRAGRFAGTATRRWRIICRTIRAFRNKRKVEAHFLQKFSGCASELRDPADRQSPAAARMKRRWGVGRWVPRSYFNA